MQTQTQTKTAATTVPTLKIQATAMPAEEFDLTAAAAIGVLGSRPAYVTDSGVESFACCHALTAHG
jgi:hypothetical protein